MKELKEPKKVIVTVVHIGKKPVGVKLQFLNGVPVGSYSLARRKIKSLRTGDELFGYRVAGIRRVPPVQL